MTTVRDRRWKSKGEDKDLWRSLTDGWRELRLALSTGPTSQLREVEFTGPAASLAFAVPGVITRPAGVTLVSLYRTDTGETSAVTFSWTFPATNLVTTPSFSALAATTWRATFHVIGGA